MKGPLPLPTLVEEPTAEDTAWAEEHLEDIEKDCELGEEQEKK